MARIAYAHIKSSNELARAFFILIWFPVSFCEPWASREAKAEVKNKINMEFQYNMKVRP